MCPMRFILVFFSALLAGYMAWRTVRSAPDIDADDVRGENFIAKDKQKTNLFKMMQNGFWVFVDMASGRYLWKNLRDINKIDKVETCN
ncbi:hypothetical protein DCAR_0417325 [Daucus carota subsp. sativus]|uniref:Uncharacterized protein n=1 Tax=Daucus carota subsp. sativus TaxID=79200 RepID=A0A165YBM4_DAUCS|nr:PREDICTED: uncharacterized protein LOC108216795 [Daucus carota subsp. sativus]XP_017245124.1 PREDICTED: uncharacterized protein LOC108216795 [Daucus carota subsp. sativus]WOG97984.1 hypothetical protein DCAR_0417325 [Daucus carota subsp. sativus]